ncbi:MAG: hypothetical protein KDI30_08135 [Pseudomonadales bacterium]|nr:hypothetical protein [Pseudomonadales bacterium]
MARLDQNSAEWSELLDAFVQHAHIDTHFSCCTSSAFEVDELLLSSSQTVTQHQAADHHHQVAMRLGILR